MYNEHSRLYVIEVTWYAVKGKGILCLVTETASTTYFTHQYFIVHQDKNLVKLLLSKLNDIIFAFLKYIVDIINYLCS